MKRLLRFVLVVALVLCVLPPLTAAALDEGFRVDNYHVSLTANDKREYHIVETIDVVFTEERRGIIRSIPMAGIAEDYSITDVHVDGDPFTTTESGNKLSIRIGDPDITLTGRKTYTISYTLVHYGDGMPDADYLYANLIGTEWDTTIGRVTADVALPQGSTLESYDLHVSRYGGTGNDGRAEVTVEGDAMHIEIANGLGPGEGVTLNAVLKEGAFSQAPERVYPYIIEQNDVVINVDKNKNYHYTQTITALCNEYTSEIPMRIDLAGSHGDYTMKGEVVLSGQAEGTSIYRSKWSTSVNVLLDAQEGERITFTLDYTVVPEPYDERYLQLVSVYAARYDWAVPMRNASLTINLPAAFSDARVARGRFSEDKEVEAEILDTQIIAHAEYLLPYESFTVEIAFLDGTFSRPFTKYDAMALVAGVGVLIVVLLLWWKYGRDKPLVEPVEFYPPDKLNPAEIGYIIDTTTQGRDITSLIYYFASRGHLSIHMTGNDFELHRGAPLDDSYASYEHDVYDALWALGEDGVVANKDLKDKFYTTINSAKRAVPKVFTGPQSLFDKTAATAARIAVLLGALGLAALVFISGYHENGVSILIPAIGMFAVAFFLTGIPNGLVLNHRKRQSGGVARMVIFCVVCIVIGGVVLSWMEDSAVRYIFFVISWICAWIALIIAPFVSRRSEYGQDIIGRVLGFRNFLETAEKERLEMLIDENPDYYYDILPYALVLDVTDTWAKKFDGLITEPPSWYTTDDTTFSTILLASSLNRSFAAASSSMTSSPSSSGGGSSSGGFSGGFSGGGSSGGGSGGGGGSSW